MREIENIKIGLIALRANRLRTMLTMLGVIFGVGAVIAMMSIGEGARQETLEQIELLGTNNIIINRTEGNVSSKKSKASFSRGLSMDDARSILEIHSGVEYITPIIKKKNKVTFKSKIITADIIGTLPNYPQMFNSIPTSGRFFNQTNLDSYSNVCVIGSGIKEKLFKYENAVSKKIKIGNLWFEIIGVIAAKNITQTAQNDYSVRNFNDDIYIPYSTCINKLDRFKEEENNEFIFFWGGDQKAKVIDRTFVDQLAIKIKDDESIGKSGELIEKILTRRHYGVEDFEIIIPEELLEQKQKTQRIFNIVMGAIAGISLLVGGIGIMNIMLANIMERTKEIGIRRAVGATQQNVLTQFLYESVMISLVGGILGIVIGFLLTSMITGYAEWRTSITLPSVFIAFFVSAGIGIVFGIYPAKKAASKDPIESLRYE